MSGALSGVDFMEKPTVKWADVAGLTDAKEALMKAVILPRKFPQKFMGNRRTWNGILLYGPPGTGKSYLAKAVAAEANSPFFRVTPSGLLCRWSCQSSEMLVKGVFAMAREKAPSIVFIDDLDSLFSSRSDNESESLRRIRTEFLVQIDGVDNGTDGILVLGETNTPWNLDDALLRRMEKRLLIHLPDKAARAHMLKLYIGDTPHSLTPGDFDRLASMSDGYSGSDLKTVCRDAIMEPVRLSVKATHFKKVGENGKDMYTPCSPGDPDGREMELMSIDTNQVRLPMVKMSHFEVALSKSKPSVGQNILTQFEAFAKEYTE